MKNLTLIVVAVSIVVASCRTNITDSFELADDMASLAIQEESLPPPQREATGKFSQSTIKDQMLIKTAHISLEVENYEIARTITDSLVKIYNSWISSENMYNYHHRISNQLTIRVPAANLTQLINDFVSIGKKLENQRIESVDVTEEYIDIESRLNNQRVVEKKFIALLRRTDSINEILQIESKLGEVRGLIESYEGRLKYLNNRVNYSTIHLNIYQKIDYKFIPEPMESFWERLKKSIDKGWKGLIALTLFLIKLWPLWVLSILFGYIIKRVINRKKVKPKPKKKKGKLKPKTKENKQVKQSQTEQSE